VVTPDDVARHLQVVRDLAAPGRALAPNAPTATDRNPAWFRDIAGRRITAPARRELHGRLIDEARAAAPEVQSQRRALVLAGPPGAGKSTVLKSLLGDNMSSFLVIDADDFKRALLHQAEADGSYEGWIKPEAVSELEAAGERFFPLELASLVHEESPQLARYFKTSRSRAVRT
jgi:hypothetical protein